MQRIYLLGLLANLGLVAAAAAQVPALPPAPPVSTTTVVTTAPATSNLWTYMCLTPAQRLNCQLHCCQSPFGQMMTSAMGPLSLLSGGLIQSPCAAVAIQAGLEQPADSAIGAAARIKQDEAAVAARRAAIRYLGTVDCNRWPEAKQALCDGLLKDRSECVRFEAALALQKGCCCNRDVVDALTKCITGKSDPVETSERVKAAAVVALAHCVLPDEPARIDLEKVLPEEQLKKVEFSPADKARLAQEKAQAEVLDNARKALSQIRTGELNAGVVASPSRPGTVLQLFANAYNAGSAPRSESWQPAASASQVTQAPVTPAPVAAPASSVATAANVPERRPFFEGLTQALKGKQPVLPAMATQEMPAPTATATSPGAPMPMPMPTTAPAAASPWAAMPVGTPLQSKAPASVPYSICVYSIEPSATTTTVAGQQVIPASATSTPAAGQPFSMPQAQTPNSVRLLPPPGGAPASSSLVPAPNWPVETTTLPRY